jgi:hypothetical protein
MADRPTRELGRAGLQVTMLGYDAMELRGAAHACDITGNQADNSQRRPRLRDQLNRHRDRLQFVTFRHTSMYTTIVSTVNPVDLQSNLDALRKGPRSSDL